MCRGGACFSLPRPLAGATFRPTALTAEVYTGAIGVSLMSRTASLSFIFFLIAAPSPAAVTGSTRLLRTPTVSATHIAFAYANNIWVVGTLGRHGAAPHQLSPARPPIRISRPTANGSPSARSMRATTTSTWCLPKAASPSASPGIPAPIPVQGWTPDGKSVLFTSARATWAPSAAPRFWTVPVEGGVEEPLRAASRLSGQDFAPTARTSPIA